MGQALAIDGQLRFVIGDDRQPDLPGLVSIPGQLQAAVWQDRVLVFLGMVDDLVLVGKGADVFLIDILLWNWQVVRTALLNHRQQLSRVEIVDGSAELNPVVGNPGDGTGGVEDIVRLVAGGPLEDVDGVGYKYLGDHEDQDPDCDVAPQVEGRLMVVLDEGGGRYRYPE